MKKDINGLSKIFSRQLYSDVKQLIDESRYLAAQTVNSVLSMLYWNIGSRINSEILKNGRAEYGKRGVSADTDLRLCKYFGLTDGFFIGMQMDFERIAVKRKLQKKLKKIIPLKVASV